MKERILHIFFIRSFTLIFIILCGHSMLAQTSGGATVLTKFQQHQQQVLQEKLYVHTDKSFYLAGETIWCKLYNVDASFHKPLQLSRVAYVEILDRENAPVLQTKMALEKGSGAGSITLPNEIASGNYTLRAYTNWMKNFDTELFFQKKLTVVNTVREHPVKEATKDTSAIDLQFFPEGGNLVYGIKSKVAFRAINERGSGINFNGFIISQNNDTVAQFVPTKFGIGSFEFLPQQAVTYKAIIRLPNQQTFKKELPAISNQGYVLSLQEIGSQIEVSIQSSPALENAAVQLFVHTRNSTVENFSANLNGAKAKFLVDKNKLGDGISHFTLFNMQMQPVCERLYFKRPQQSLQINVQTSEQQLQARKKVTLDVDVFDETGSATYTDLSMAVFGVDSINNYDENILSYLFLSSDLRGAIESPAYYFQEGKEVEAAIDHLMLTHGWRRFKWSEVLQSTPPVQYLPELEGPIVSAKITDAQSGEPVKGAKAYLSIPGQTFQFYTGVSNEHGKVNFYTKSFFGPNEIVAYTDGDKNYRIDIETPFSDIRPSSFTPVLNLKELNLEHVKEKSVNMQVKNIYTADKVGIKPPVVDTVVFYGKPQMNYLLDDYVRFPTMEEVLREYVREINVYRQGKNYSIGLMKKQFTGLVDRKNPIVLLDGVPVFDMNKLMAYDPLKIKQLQTIDLDYFKGPLAFEGVVSFRTYTGRPEGLQTESRALVMDYEGLQLQREFYSPVYDTELQEASRLPDFRTLLYWNPQITTNGKKQTIHFYTSDLPGKYVVLVQGLSKDGRAGSKTVAFTVENPLFADKGKK